VNAADWFSRRELAEWLTAYTEPFMNSYLRANMYLVRGRDLDLLVDTGMGVLRFSEVVPASPGKPLLALATHIHVDHVGSLHEFADRAGPAYSAADFAAMPDAVTYASSFAALAEPVSRPPSPDWQVEAYAIAPAPLTRTLSEGDVVDLGDRQFRVLHLAGHSPDSIALLDERGGIFLSGDAIYDDHLIDDLPDSDRAAYRATMARILELPVRMAYGGHGEPFDGRRMREIARNYTERSEA
jgi:glyoxylase-like metal-dependent hydrolase (beta-lactamase superfamily II)